MPRSKQKQAYYDRLNAKYGEKYGIDGRSVAHIRSSAIGGKGKADIIAHCDSKIFDAKKVIETKQEEIARFTQTRDFLTQCSNEAYADITNAKPAEEEHGQA